MTRSAFFRMASSSRGTSPARAVLPLIVALLLASTLTSSAAAQGALTGTVVSEGEPVPFANVGLRGTTLGAATTMEGGFTIHRVPAGTYTVVASAVGFASAEQEVTVGDGDTLRVTLHLDKAVVQGEGVVVTGTLVETYVKDSPVKVDVVSPQYLGKIPTANIMEVLENVNGLYQQIDCGVCGTNNIRVNGMDGPYTAVLIDGMPIMSSLATVYGLNGISPSLLQQVEIIKGPMSTLYGSEAMGGVINVITKHPRTAPTLAVNTFATSDAEFAADAGYSFNRGRVSGLVSGTAFYNDRFLDENDDGFADLTLNTRGSVFTKASVVDTEGRRQADLSARYYHEDRMGGTEQYVDNFEPSFRGSDEVYGESIRTNRVELVGTYHLAPEQGVKVDGAFNWHDQDSFYGSDHYQAQQTTAFAQLLAPVTLGDAHSLRLGGALRVQRYDDNTGSTGRFDDVGRLLENQPDNRTIPGAFAEHEWVPVDAFRLITGLRADYQADHGVIPAPRLSMKVRPAENTTVRLNAGTGFRIVNLFTEDHAAYTGARATVLLEDLDPERSYNGTVGLEHVIPLGANPLTIELDGFYSYFTNKIEPNYDTPGLILYENLDGSATTRGASLTLSQSLTAIPLTYTIGGTVMDVFTHENGTQEPLEFAPDYQGVANATYRLPAGFAIDYTMNLTGPMKLPEYDAPFQRPSESPAFSVHNLQLTKDVDLPNATLAQVYISVENVFDYTQGSPLVDPAHPFGENFDTNYVYGPIHGRCMGLGVRLTVP